MALYLEEVRKILSNVYFVCSFNKAKDLITKLHDEYGYLVSHDLMLHREEECNIKISSHKSRIDYVSLDDTDELKYNSMMSYNFISELLNTISMDNKEEFNSFFSKKRFLIYYDMLTDIDLLFLLDKHKSLFKDIKIQDTYGCIVINSNNSYPLFKLDAINFKVLLNLKDKLKYTYKD